MKTTVNVELVIFGDSFEVQYITETLRISPTDKWEKGDFVREPNIIRDHTCWTVGIGHQESFDIENQSMNLLSIVGHKSSELLKLQTELKIESLILYTIYVYNGERPSMSLGNEIINFASKINAHIDFDLYDF